MRNKMTIDIQSIVQKYSHVEEVNEVMGVWEIWIEHCPVKLKIKVHRMSSSSKAPYVGIANHSIQNPDQAHGYISIHNCQTVQEAFDDALKGFFVYFKPELVEKTKFDLVEDW